MVSGQNEQNVQAIAAMSSATKASTLVVLGSERAVFAAGLAALLVAVGAGVCEEVLFRGLRKMDGGRSPLSREVLVREWVVVPVGVSEAGLDWAREASC